MVRDQEDRKGQGTGTVVRGSQAAWKRCPGACHLWQSDTGISIETVLRKSGNPVNWRVANEIKTEKYQAAIIPGAA
jgi:hypothetical protein